MLGRTPKRVNPLLVYVRHPKQLQGLIHNQHTVDVNSIVSSPIHASKLVTLNDSMDPVDTAPYMGVILTMNGPPINHHNNHSIVHHHRHHLQEQQ